MSAAGASLGAWTLVEPMGRGSSGEVWRARRVDGLYEAEAAIKLLRSDLSVERLAGRFARERAVLARLDHPGIARMLDAGVHDGQAFIVLEQVHGTALDAHARAHAPLLAQRVRLLLQVAEAVEHAHALLVVHRDLKPANVLVTPEGRTKLLDFGIAALLDDDGPAGELTRLAGRALTPGYAAPEQIAGHPVAAAADLFALGVMLYELIDGSLPFASRGAARAAMEHAVLHDEPRRIGSVEPDADGPGRPVDARRARGDLEAIAAKALRKDPAARYASVRALIDELQRWLDHRPVAARRDDWRHRTGLFVRRHALLVAATASVTVALAAGLAVAGWQWWRAEAEARRAEAVTAFLSDMIESAGPETHRGKQATVTDLLDEGATQLPTRFAADPQTRLRLLQVLVRVNLELNRFEPGLSLAEEWVHLARLHHGPDSNEALLATGVWARGQQSKQARDQARAQGAGPR